MVTRQLQVERRTGKVCRPKTDVLPLSLARAESGLWARMHAMERASPEFLPLNAVRSRVDAFCWIKNTQKSISALVSPPNLLTFDYLLPPLVPFSTVVIALKVIYSGKSGQRATDISHQQLSPKLRDTAQLHSCINQLLKELCCSCSVEPVTAFNSQYCHIKCFRSDFNTLFLPRINTVADTLWRFRFCL